MTSIDDLAESHGGPEIVLARDLAQQGVSTIRETDLYGHDDLTPEGQFPEYGQFLRVEIDGDEAYWECPGGLAEEIVKGAQEQETEIPGCRLEVTEIVQTTSGFRFRVDLRPPDSS